ncbi:alkaline shock response membrane anchor protein AmaP [Amycolatopsis sp. WQ 127309]|uniref:alkaline shock response membrane anchor protein AmaP n=1 Tax=Amycolatopsis sp. WQ 127309 TaxID=2932773 RepID=UPI001FF56B45|nr:alkaline shock response membrane anchor protein AmaP [Amycolatopsis sp. WQ 127309]UOZ04891.1 alkaline shock response membrane anchor protein AmaP [Amycolatopsis sp. WQ 127309]
MTNRPAALNRALLAFVGSVLLAAGAFAVLTHFGTLPAPDRGSALVPGPANPPTWALYVITAVAVVLGFALLRWLAAQLVRKPKTHSWRWEAASESGRTELAASAAAEPFVDEVKSYPGVHAAHATLAGTRDTPALALVISAEHDGDLTTIRHRLEIEGLPRLRQALDLEALPVTVEFRFSTKNGARTGERRTTLPEFTS